MKFHFLHQTTMDLSNCSVMVLRLLWQEFALTNIVRAISIFIMITHLRCQTHHTKAHKNKTTSHYQHLLTSVN